jgi:POT family proton-dependent oligopeptide transporter
MSDTPEHKQSPLREIIQPFIDLIHAPRALWGINLAYVIEGMVYFGMLSYLAIHFSDFVFRGMAHADELSHMNVMVLTAGITIAMFFLGFVTDKWGVRFALIAAFSVMLVGRALMSAAPTVLKLQPAGLWSPLHLVTLAGILFVVIGYGMYQPAAYAGVRQFTTPKTAAMGFAMLYALMNLGGWLPTFAFLLRDDDFLGLGIPGTFWVYTGFTLVALAVTALILSKKTVADAIATAKAETQAIKAAEAKGAEPPTEAKPEPASADFGGAESTRVPWHMWLFAVAAIVAEIWRVPAPWNYYVGAAIGVLWVAACLIPQSARFLARHPLANAKFAFFIFALIPVQTLFTYNWFILPQYINRAFAGWIGQYFEIAANANPLLIFIAVPIITAVTQKAKVYNMMIIGTFVMAAPAFLNVIGPYWWTLGGFILIMTIGEAMWQPRFLQYAAEIAPEGRTGEYMGVAQFPWFLTKMLVPLLYSGWMMEHYCPPAGPGVQQNTQFMWFIFGCIAICSTILLILAKGWIGKDFKTKHS